MSSISLSVQGMGNVPSFKNSKRAILDSRNGKLRTLTPKATKALMEAIVESFVSQLWSVSQTGDGGIWMGPSAPSLIVSSLPADDSINDIVEINIRSERVPKGQEGAHLTIVEVPWTGGVIE